MLFGPAFRRVKGIIPACSENVPFVLTELAFWRNLPIAAKASIAIAAPLLVLAAGFELVSDKFDASVTRRHLVETIGERESLDRLSQNLFAMESALRSYLL